MEGQRKKRKKKWKNHKKGLRKDELGTREIKR